MCAGVPSSLLRVFALCGLIAAASSAVFAASPASKPADSSTTRKAQVIERYGELPLTFEANQGQTDPRVKFLSRGNGYSLFLTDSGAVLALSNGNAAYRPDRPLPGARREPGGPGLAFETWESTKSRAIGPGKTDVVRMELSGASKGRQVSGAERLPGTANYFIGSNPAKWHAGVPTYAKVRYAGVYPGVDLFFYGKQEQLEYDFVVAPGADPRTIRLQFDGARKLSLTPSGDLTVTAKNGSIAFHNPDIYQEDNGQRRHIPGRFSLLAGSLIGFSLGRYNHAAPLVIDPALAYSSYLGGNISDSAYATAVDAAGNAYVAGFTESTNFPVTTGALQTENKDPSFGNAFVSKLNSTGTELLYSTYLGSSGSLAEIGSIAAAIAVDRFGNAYVAGITGCCSFPVTAGAFQTADPGPWGETGFVTKLNPTGTGLVYSTFLGGSLGSRPNAIAVDGSGNAYVAGATSSVDFPVTTGALQTKIKSPYGNAFVAELNPTGSALVYSTYLGGSGNTSGAGDIAYALALNGTGEAYIAGTTSSTDFPVTNGALQTANKTHGKFTAFISRLNPTGTALLYSTYLGGSTFEQAYALQADESGSAYVAGYTWSTDFPVTKGAFQPANKGGNAFITRLNQAGSALLYSTYLGGSTGEQANSVAVDRTGNAYVAGYTFSTDFPVTPGAFQTTNKEVNVNSTGFVSKLNSTGSALLYSTYLGGSGYSSSFDAGDYANAISLDSSGNAYVAGATYSIDFPVTPGAFQTKDRSASQIGSNAFITKLNLGSFTTAATDTTLIASANPQAFGRAVEFTVTVAASDASATPSGSVVFTVDGKSVAKVSLTGAGEAAYSTSALAPGAHFIAANYGGTSIFSFSSASLTETIIEPQAAAPIFSPAEGTFGPGQMVTISDKAIAGLVIHYTLRGNTPTKNSNVYSAPIRLSRTTTIEAIAVAPGYTDSIVASATYTIDPPAPTPTFSPAAGTVASGQIVKIGDTAFEGLVIYYTTNGDAPTTSSTKYTSAGIKVTATETIKAIAVATGYSQSAVASAKYTVN